METIIAIEYSNVDEQTLLDVYLLITIEHNIIMFEYSIIDFHKDLLIPATGMSYYEKYGKIYKIN